MSEASMIEEAFARGRELERNRCARLVCQDCANGIWRGQNWTHIIETIQGHIAHERACLARSILEPLVD